MPLNPVPNFPTSLDTLPDPTSTTYTDDDGFELDLLLKKLNAIVELLEAKAGISESSAQDTPLANTVLQSLTNGKAKWATIITAMLAANAVTQNGFAAGATGTQTTTSGSYADLAEMSVTLTTTGGDLLVFFLGAFAHSTLGAATVTALKLDAAAEVGAFSLNANVATYTFLMANIRRFTGVSAASHTVKVRWLTNAATASANGSDRYLLVVELKK